MDEEQQDYWNQKYAEETKTAMEAISLKSPDGTVYIVTVTDDGTLDVAPA